VPSKRQASGAVKTLRAFIKKCKDARAQHPTTSKKKRKKARKDPSWFGHKKGHRKAAKKGLRKKAKRGGKKKTARDWRGHKKGHAKAAKKGWRGRHHARRDPAGFRRGRLGRRQGAAGPWYMTRDPG
jgi:hypothetical protein